MGPPVEVNFFDSLKKTENWFSRPMIAQCRPKVLLTFIKLVLVAVLHRFYCMQQGLTLRAIIVADKYILMQKALSHAAMGWSAMCDCGIS